MAQQPQPQYEFHYQRVELLKTEELGVGSYGAVCKAMCDDLPCAAKILHRTLFQFTAPGSTSIMKKFEQECRLLSAIKHPHIVQYLGTYHDPESKLPVLLMELMDESLTRFLERSHEPLPYYTEVNLCHDIALALSYLHSNGIIHRDLSSNNVLLIAGSRAKVTDFGMVKLYDVNRSTAHLTPLTQCPGTTVYMSPEALGEPPVYTDKLDSFSLGVLGVQIMTRQFPDPGNRFKIMEINDPRIPSGTVQVSVPEIERRQSHIDLIDPAHPLLPVALDCLKDRDRERPSCHELCGCMSTLKASPKYTESVQQPQVVNTKPAQSANRESRERERQQIQDLQQQLGALRDQVHIKDDQLQAKEQETQQQQQQILRQRHLLTATSDQLQKLQQQLTTKDKQLAGKEHQLQQKEATIAEHQQVIQQLRQQLEKVIAEFQKHLLEREKQERAETRGGRGCGAAVNAGSNMGWRDGRRALCEEWGKVTADVIVPEILHEDMNLSTVKCTPVVTDTRYYIDNDYYSTSVPECEEGKGSSSVKVRKAVGYHFIDLPKGHEQLDQEQANDAVTPLKEVKSKAPPPIPPQNLPPKPPPYHKGDLSPMSGSSVPPPLPKRDHPKPSSTDKSTSTTTLEGKILKGEVFQPPSRPPPLPPPYRPSSPLSPVIGGEVLNMDDFPPETGYKVVANVRGKGGQKKAGAFNLVYIDESAIKGSALIERPSHLYSEILDDHLPEFEEGKVNHAQEDTELKEAECYLLDVPESGEDTDHLGYYNVDVSEYMDFSTGKHTPVADGPGYYNVDVPEGKNLSTGEHAPVAERPGYYNVDFPEGKNLSTGKHTPVADGPGYYNIDFPEGENLSTGEHAPVAERPGYYNVDFPEGENLSTGEHAPVAERPGYYNVDFPEGENLSTGEHAPVAERPGYYNVDFPEGKNHSTGKHFPVPEASGYYNVELPEQSPSKVEKNLLTVKHPPVVTDACGYCDIDLPELSPPDENENLAMVKHPSVVTDARGYCDIDVPDLSPPEENLATIKHPPIVIDAHGYCNVGQLFSSDW